MIFEPVFWLKSLRYMAFLEYRFAKRYFTPSFSETICETIAERFSHKSLSAKDKIRNDYRFVALRRERFVSLSLLRGETRNETVPRLDLEGESGEWPQAAALYDLCPCRHNNSHVGRRRASASPCIYVGFSVSAEKNHNNRKTSGQRQRPGGDLGGGLPGGSGVRHEAAQWPIARGQFATVAKNLGQGEVF